MASFMSGICAAMRPLAKELIKDGIIAIDAISEFVAEAGEQIKDLVAEAKSEMPSAREKTAMRETAKDEPGRKSATR